MKQEKKITTLALDSIIPYENNPRDNDETVPFLMNSMEKHGYNSLIEVNEDNVILVGHTRLKALKQLQLKGKLGKGKLSDTKESSVKVLVIKGLSPAEQKAYRIANNKVGEPSGWLFDKLNIELKEIKELDPLFNGEDFGFIEVDNSFVETAPEIPETMEIEIPVDEKDDVPTVLQVFFDDKAEAYELLDRLKNEGYRCKLE